MPTPETPTSGEDDKPKYTEGDPVRVYLKRDEEQVAEDDWEYKKRNKHTGHEVAAKHRPEGDYTEIVETPKDEFDNWQKERAAEEAGKLAVEATVGATDDVEEIVEEEEEKHEAEKPKWGSFDEEGNYKLAISPEELASEIGIPAEVIRAAAEKNFPPEFLLSAKDNPYTAKHLRDAGIEFGAEFAEETAVTGVAANIHPERLRDKLPKAPTDVELLTPEEREKLFEKHGVSTMEEYKALYEDEREKYRERLDDYLGRVKIDQSADPMFHLEAQSAKKTLRVEDIAKLIEDKPAEVSKLLERPGGIDLLRNIPLLNRLGHISLALAMNRKEKEERKKDGLGRSHEDGLLRVGLPRIKRNLAYIKKQDEDVKVYKNKLNRFNRQDYKGADKTATRRDLAQLIERTRKRGEALREHKILHQDVLKFEDFRKPYGAFKDNKPKASPE